MEALTLRAYETSLSCFISNHLLCPGQRWDSIKIFFPPNEILIKDEQNKSFLNKKLQSQPKRVICNFLKDRNRDAFFKELRSARELALGLAFQGHSPRDIKLAFQRAAYFAEIEMSLNRIPKVQTRHFSRNPYMDSISLTQNCRFLMKDHIWPNIRTLLTATNWTIKDIGNIFVDEPEFFVLSRPTVQRNLKFLFGNLKTRSRFCIITNTPIAMDGILRMHEIKRIVLQWPRILRLDPLHVRKILRYFLEGDSISTLAQSKPRRSLTEEQVVSMIKTYPQILAKSTEELDAIIFYVQNTLDIKLPREAFTTYPYFMGRKQGEIQEIFSFYCNILNFEERELPNLVRKHPHILNLEIFRAHAAFQCLKSSFSYSEDQRHKIIRTFPGILRTLSPERLQVVKEYLYSKGLSSDDIENFILAIPPILMWDIENQVELKWNFIQEHLFQGSETLAKYHILEYPGILGHNIHTRIWPRARFLREVVGLKEGLGNFTLKQLIAPSDDHFLAKVSREKSDYLRFLRVLREAPV